MRRRAALTDDDIRALIRDGVETPNLDYKRTALWGKKDKSDRLEITKDILAMSNTRDGGKIVIGVDDKTKEYIGLDEKSYKTFEQTSVNQFVAEFADPSFTCNVIKRPDLDGKRVIVIDVPEFVEEPIICKKNGHNSKGVLVIFKGGLYIRTKKCSSELVSSVGETRSVLERGLNKKSDEILSKISNLLDASEKRQESTHRIQVFTQPKTEIMRERPFQAKEAQKSFYVGEVKETDSYFSRKINKLQGGWKVIARPKSYNFNLFDSPVEAYSVLKNSIVSLRGWDFPHDDNHGNSKNFVSGHQSFTMWERHNEAWRIFKSGLFVWKSGYWEDYQRETDGEAKVLSFVNIIYQCTEILLFLKRLYSNRIGLKDIFFEISLRDCEGRKLESFQPGVFIGGNYVSDENIISIKKELSSVKLGASAEKLARDISKEIFMIFNWNNPADSMIEDWQKRLIEKSGF